MLHHPGKLQKRWNVSVLIPTRLSMASKKIQLDVQNYIWDIPAMQTLDTHIQGDAIKEMEDDMN